MLLGYREQNDILPFLLYTRRQIPQTCMESSPVWNIIKKKKKSVCGGWGGNPKLLWSLRLSGGRPDGTRWPSCYNTLQKVGLDLVGWLIGGSAARPGASRPRLESSIKVLESFSRWIGRSSFRTTPRASSWQSGKAHTEKSGESVHSITMPCAQINKREKRSHHVNWLKAWWAQEVVSIHPDGRVLRSERRPALGTYSRQPAGGDITLRRWLWKDLLERTLMVAHHVEKGPRHRAEK